MLHPPSGNCNCQIIISTGHNLTIPSDLTIGNAYFVLKGALSKLTLAAKTALVLTNTTNNTSGFDLQNSQASIVLLSHPQTRINLKGQNIFTSGTASFGTSSPATGTVMGPASASSGRTSPFFTNVVLPVKLSEFKLTSQGGKVLLSWTSEQEINSEKFEIERSSDSKSWNTIGSVNASGNVSVSKSYSFTDANPINGSNYYRLKMIDLDTKFEYSSIKTVNISASFQVASNPNPASNVLNVSISSQNLNSYSIKLFNRTGQLVHSQKVRGSITKTPVVITNYPEGSYFLEISDDRGFKQVNKVVILRKK